MYGDWVNTHIRYDWPKTPHDKSAIDVFGSVMELPFVDHSFDVVLCTEVLEHVPEPVKTLKEFHRVLKPGGHLILSVPFLYQTHEQPYDFFRYTPFGLHYMFTQAGFNIITCEARGEIVAVILYFLKKFTERMITKIAGAKISKKMPYLIPDWIYLMLMSKKLLHLDAMRTNYTLGYTVTAGK